MKKSRGTMIFLFVIYIGLVTFLQSRYEWVAYVLAFLVGGFLLFSIIVRRNIHFKPYFTSKYNFLTSKVRHQKQIDLPKDILFEKLREVLTEAGFTIRYADKAAGSLLATSKISFYSWGENIYLDLEEKNGITKVEFCSACLFGVTSWGRNEKNYEHLFDTFDNLLTI
jgi:hypothetical protein